MQAVVVVAVHGLKWSKRMQPTVVFRVGLKLNAAWRLKAATLKLVPALVRTLVVRTNLALIVHCHDASGVRTNVHPPVQVPARLFAMKLRELAH